MELYRTNSTSDLEDHINGMNPSEEIVVIETAQYYYVYDSTYFPNKNERLVYEGPAFAYEF